jgi:hypothetical protein
MEVVNFGDEFVSWINGDGFRSEDFDVAEVVFIYEEAKSAVAFMFREDGFELFKVIVGSVLERKCKVDIFGKSTS